VRSWIILVLPSHLKKVNEPMHIIELLEKPIHRIQFLNAAKGGGVESQALPILKGLIDALPTGVEALLIASDVQGVVKNWQLGANRLLGIELAEVYRNLSAQNLVPDPAVTGVILAGDLYASPAGDKRGASGDVREVWRAFAQDFRWVVGVAGNHDRFGTATEQQELESLPSVHLLDYGLTEVDSLRIGGISNIIGDPAKPGRRDEQEFLTGLQLVLEAQPTMVVLHQGPQAGEGFPGCELVEYYISKAAPPLTICGHVHWSKPLFQGDRSTQILNVDSRAIVLTT
jgi:3',5'-cyclic-AMP phosphodiesterase